jgi:hypothetical protein
MWGQNRLLPADRILNPAAVSLRFHQLERWQALKKNPKRTGGLLRLGLGELAS